MNPPSQILVAKPTIVYLLIDPQTDAYILAGKLNDLRPQSAEDIDSGETKWANVMEASLAGGDFIIDPSVPLRKTLSPTEVGKWSWVITPKHPGKNLLLSLAAKAILPENIAPPYEVILLHKEIDVEVTLWWLFDHYFDKYWKWLLAGLSGLITGIFSWWWKARDKAESSTRKRKPFKVRH